MRLGCAMVSQPAVCTSQLLAAGPTKGVPSMPTKYRADQVGSFLRPQEVLDAHVAHRDGKLPLEQLRAIEDKAIIDCLAMQKTSGIDVYSDGEFRRAGWSSDFAASVE